MTVFLGASVCNGAADIEEFNSFLVAFAHRSTILIPVFVDER